MWYDFNRIVLYIVLKFFGIYGTKRRAVNTTHKHEAENGVLYKNIISLIVIHRLFLFSFLRYEYYLNIY